MDTLRDAERGAEMHVTKSSDRAFRVVLADDHEDVLHEVRALLNRDFEILNSVTDGLTLIDAVREWKPDVVISDFKMPGLSGIETCCHILQNGFCGAAIILTMYSDIQLVRDALRAGIRGYVLKVDAGEELVSAVREVLSGSTYLSHGVSRNWTE